ncbi:MAG: Fe2+-dependent dioxygenase [Novosphingobium sp.]
MMVVIESVLDSQDLAEIRGALDAAHWEAGNSTVRGAGRDRKVNHQLKDGTEPALSLGDRIVQKLWTNPLFISAALPRQVYPPRFNRYGVGETYGAHVDAALMRPASGGDMVRTDLSITVFLTDPADYDGGELEIEGNYGAQAVKLAAGDAVLYPATSLHRVAPVARGARYASFFWIESLVQDLGERTLLFELDQTIQRLTAELGPNHDELPSLQAVYHNLLRRWVRT